MGWFSRRKEELEDLVSGEVNPFEKIGAIGLATGQNIAAGAKTALDSTAAVIGGAGEIVGDAVITGVDVALPVLDQAILGAAAAGVGAVTGVASGIANATGLGDNFIAEGLSSASDASFEYANDRFAEADQEWEALSGGEYLSTEVNDELTELADRIVKAGDQTKATLVGEMQGQKKRNEAHAKFMGVITNRDSTRDDIAKAGELFQKEFGRANQGTKQAGLMDYFNAAMVVIPGGVAAKGGKSGLKADTVEAATGSFGGATARSIAKKSGRVIDQLGKDNSQKSLPESHTPRSSIVKSRGSPDMGAYGDRWAYKPSNVR